MCGINGIVFQENDFVPLKVLEKMNKVISHRGPDDEGYYTHQQVGLAMRRLSIIDLDSGKQPISNENETIHIVFNGEIYNYESLRNDLMNKGVKFKTKSDTETILKLYELYQEDCVKYLNGMFAFAIYDENEDTIFLARDRAGEKPLYYYLEDGMFVFSSELKGILEAPIKDLSIDKVALSQYFYYTYIPSPRSIYNEIKKLPAGSYAYFNNGEIKISSYFSFETNTLYDDYSHAKNDLELAIRKAVKECLVSDVPIGAFLSGGFDSTVITVLANEYSKGNITAYTLAHGNKKYDESKLAKKTAEKFGIKHKIVYLNESMFEESIKPLIDNMDEPFGDSSLIASYVITNVASSNGMKTMLTGDAGDELFGGYNKYLINYYLEKINRLPRPLISLLKAITGFLRFDSSLKRKTNKVLSSYQLDNKKRHLNLMSMGFDLEQINKLIPDLDNISNINESFENVYKTFGHEDQINQSLKTDFQVVLEGDMLTKVDRSSMLNSLETRTPLLHPEVLSVVKKIPSHYKIKGKKRKIIFKDIFSKLIPIHIKKAPKMGFAVPMSNWISDQKIVNFDYYISEEFIGKQNLFDHSFITDIYSKHINKTQDSSNGLWTFYVFQRWYENNILGQRHD